LEVHREDEAGNSFRILALVCSLSCQKLLVDEEVAAGRPECRAWQPENLRAALEDSENFKGIIDLSIENIARRIVDGLDDLAVWRN
jgi:hypothetical protein